MNRRLELFPQNTRIENGELMLGGLSARELAQKFGTPLYLFDQAELDSAVSRYRRALAEFWPGASAITYAGKAFLNTRMAQWAQGQGLRVDCTGQGEIELAVHAGLSAREILVHGVSKSRADLLSALRHAGTLVADNLSELRHLAALPAADKIQIWLRYQPGLAVETHAYTQTGHSGSKFGMGAAELLQAAQFCRANGLRLTGIHFHQGSQFRDPAPLGPAIDAALELAAQMNLDSGWHFCPGGGWGVAYHEDELPQPNVAGYVRFVAERALAGIKRLGLEPPTLHLEPGRSLAARAGVALYRVETVKRSGGRVWALVDGGLADNPRPALYGARYSCLPANQVPARDMEEVSIAGPYCESGDILIASTRLPRVQEGEVLAIPVSGAYHLSMASNYNGARRPALVWLAQGRASLVRRREENSILWAADVEPD
ncbi:MAG: diaminopimelate decarboxylase [Anaerolineales bacterium]